MIIDFTDDELVLVFDALEELRISDPDEHTLDLIGSVFDKIWKARETK
jgi:hypothetical protein